VGVAVGKAGESSRTLPLLVAGAVGVIDAVTGGRGDCISDRWSSGSRGVTGVGHPRAAHRQPG
jgi:hypothetical protein